MPQRWVLAFVAEIPEAIANYILCSHCRRKPATPNSVVSGSGVGSDVAPGPAVAEGVGTAVGWVVGLGAPVHPASSTARSSAPAPSSPSSMDFDIIALPSAGFSAVVASKLALRMTRRKVLVPMPGGIFV